MDRTFDMILRNLRNEVNRIVKDNADKESIIHVQENMISRLNDRVASLEKELGRGVDYDPAA